MMDRPAWAEVDLSAIAYNVASTRGILGPGTRLCAVVKADGYGHGAAAVARTALEAGAGSLAVALVSEGIELRRAGFTCPVLVLGASRAEQAFQAVGWELEAAVAGPGEAGAFSEAALALGKTARLHFKVDTGMARLGASPREAPALAAAVARLPRVELAGLFTHLAAADLPDPAFAREQLALFLDCAAALRALGVEPPLLHAANSAAALAIPEARLGMARVGIATYGILPDPAFAPPFPLVPAMRFVARVAALRDLPAGASVGYGRTWTAPRACRVATVPVGYADGFPRALSNRGQVSIGGRRAPVVGRVCMDMFMVDVTELPGVATGDEVLLFGGPSLPIEEYAALFGSIGYEAACLVGKRVPRLYVEGRGGRTP